MTRSRHVPAVLLFLALSVTIGCFGPSGAPTRPENETLRNGEDVLAHGSTPHVMDSVAGDLIITGGDVMFSGNAGGDYLGAGGKQVVAGHIHGSMRAVGGELHTRAVVDRNTTLAGGRVEIEPEGAIDGNAYLAGGTVTQSGAVRGSLFASGGTIILNGAIGRDVQVAGGNLEIGPAAQIAGNLTYRVPPKNVKIDKAARIGGKVTALPVPSGWTPFRFLWLLGFLVVGVAVVALVPALASQAAGLIPEAPGRSILYALAWIILVPIGMIIAAVTVIGIPLACVALAVYFVLIYLGRVPFAIWLGALLLRDWSRPGWQGALINFALGALVLIVLGLIPGVGGLLWTIATILGLGAFLLRVQTMRRA